RLVAYVVVAQPQVAQPEHWLARLQAELPAYMVPAAYVALAALPLTPSGKIDRQALPEPQAQALVRATAGAGHVAPATPTEQQLAELWARLLRTDASGIALTDDFFALGGHSLMLVQLTRLIKTNFEVELTVRDALAHPSVQGMAAVIDTLASQARQARDLQSASDGQVEEVEF
ncbi:MAG: hypothetical protein JNL93_00250, partial [Pelomonas sp.]|nr:hypothetical protein [Roseateles sp.]